MVSLLALATALFPSPLDLEVSARLGSTELLPDGRHELTIDVRLPAGVLATAAGAPGPMLQIDAPDCVQLVGKHLSTAQELAGNNHLRAPFERIVPSGSSTIEFDLVAAPGPDDRIGLNFVGYLSSADGERERFVRHRLELALAPGADAQAVDGVSDWGPDPGLLQIGDAVQPVELWDGPDENRLVDLGRWVGRSWSVVLTYRAHW